MSKVAKICLKLGPFLIGIIIQDIFEVIQMLESTKIGLKLGLFLIGIMIQDMFKVSRKSEVAKICLKLGLFLIGIIISKTDPKLGILSAKCRVGWRCRKGTTDLKSKTTCAKVECRTMCRVGWWFSTGTKQFRKSEDLCGREKAINRALDSQDTNAVDGCQRMKLLSSTCLSAFAALIGNEMTRTKPT